MIFITFIRFKAAYGFRQPSKFTFNHIYNDCKEKAYRRYEINRYPVGTRGQLR